MLAGAFADGEVLQLRRARAPNRHSQFTGGLECPDFRVRGRDMRKGHFHAVGIFAAQADLVNQINGQRRRRRWVENQVCSRDKRASESEFSSFGVNTDTASSQLFGNEVLWQGLAAVPMNESKHAATRSA